MRLLNNTHGASESGFTLMELLVAMVVSGVVTASTVLICQSMIRSHNTQVKITAMQQNLRAAMFYLERTIRMAGYDPTSLADAGFTTILSNRIAFTVDKGTPSGSDLDDNPNGTIDSHWEEQVEFRLKDNRLERINSANVGLLVADNIEAINFVYLDEDSQATTVASSVRSIQVTLIGRVGTQAGFTNNYTDNNVYTNRSGSVILPAQNDNIRRMALTSTISCRNLRW